MSGFAAILAYTPAAPPVDGGELTRIRDRMAARGPDGAGQWIDAQGRVGLAHRRLAVPGDDDAPPQPLADDGHRLTLVLDGRIYNAAHLRAELEDQGETFRTQSDAETVLALYRRHGRAMLGRLRGMFALALWDDAAQGLLLARDGLGVKPLYVADNGRCLRAASQVKALLAGGMIGRDLDPAGQVGFFLWGHVPEPHTLWRGIRALAPGGWLWVTRDGQRDEGRFCDLAADMAAARADTVVADPEYLRAALADAVAHHLTHEHAPGLLLSGGLESTTLAGLAAQYGVFRPKSVTLGFAEALGTAHDGASLAETVARFYQTDHETHRVGAGDFHAARAAILADMDQPSVEGVTLWFAARAARRRGLKVALSAVGGEEVFGGCESVRQIPRHVRLAAPWQWAGGPLRKAMQAWARGASPVAAGAVEYGGSISDAYLLRRAVFMPWELDQILDPDLAAEGLAALAPRRHLADTIAAVKPDRLRLAALDACCVLRNQKLRDADWAGLAHGLEIRTPFADVALWRALLPGLAGAKPWSRRQFAAVVDPQMPFDILAQATTGGFVPQREWTDSTTAEAGVRGWARHVYADCTGGL